MDALASSTQLADLGLLPQGVDPWTVDALLESVSAAVRDAAGAPITLTTSTVTLAGTWEQFLPLPAGPVRSVASVAIEGKPVTDAKVRDNRLWRPAGWGGQHVDIEVTYTHGLDEVPADIVQLVCMLVGAGLNQAAEGGLAPDRTLAYEAIDDYRYGVRTGDDEIIDPTELPQRVKNSLRARFGGQAAVTGSY